VWQCSSWEVNVELAASRQLPKAARLALIGVATAFAWIVIALALGFGAGNAQADDGDEQGLLGAVTSLVDDTAEAVTDTASTVTGGVTGVVSTVVDVAPAPVQQPVRDVVQTVGAVVTTVTQPVADIASSGVVSAVTTPVVDLVAEVPIVGGVATAVGLDDAVTDLSGTVDDTLGGVVGTVDETGATIGRPPATTDPGVRPTVPGIPDLPGPGVPGDVLTAAVTAAVPVANAMDASTDAFTRGGSFAARGLPDAASANVLPPTSLASAAPGAGGVADSAGLCLSSASSGPGGAGSGAWAIAALGPLDAHRAWVLRSGLEDEHAPPAPAGSTDVSPD
jgi:hypothetical protein